VRRAEDRVLTVAQLMDHPAHVRTQPI
jgi:hypothetical protein